MKKKDKFSLEADMARMNLLDETIEEEGLRCGHCAAYPCRGGRFRNAPARLCFQRVKSCGSRCRNYKTSKTLCRVLESEAGICSVSRFVVCDGDICGIDELRESRIETPKSKFLLPFYKAYEFIADLGLSIYDRINVRKNH